jgi:hypothetical protein
METSFAVQVWPVYLFDIAVEISNPYRNNSTTIRRWFSIIKQTKIVFQALSHYARNCWYLAYIDLLTTCPARRTATCQQQKTLVNKQHEQLTYALFRLSIALSHWCRNNHAKTARIDQHVILPRDAATAYRLEHKKSTTMLLGEHKMGDTR